MLDPVFKHHDEVAAIQPTWHCLLRFRQRVKLEPGTDAAVASIDSHLDHGPAPRATAPKLNEIEPDPIKLSGYNGFQRLVHVLSKVPYKNKKMWGASPTFRSRTIPAQQIQGTRRSGERQAS